MFTTMIRSIVYRLPILRQRLKESQQELKQRIEALPPPPPENPASEVLKLVTGFSAEVGALILGTKSLERLMQQCRPAYAQLKRDIRSTAPRFVPFTSYENSSGFTGPVFESEALQDDGDDMAEESLPECESAAFEDSSGSMNLDQVRIHIRK